MPARRRSLPAIAAGMALVILPALGSAGGSALAGMAGATRSAGAADLASSHDAFCALVQHLLVDTPLPVDNDLHVDKDAFTKSKPLVEPVTTQQFLQRDPAGRVRDISCKTKSADHLRAIHGDAAARDPAAGARSCRDVQRRVVMDVWKSLDGAQRAAAAQPPQRLMLDPDVLSYTGSSWIGTPAEVRIGEDGRLHLQASALFAEWDDWRWKFMPQSFRGNHYCHLVAPERVRRLLLGEELLSR